MGKIIAVYTAKLTVRSDSLEDVELTNDAIGDALTVALHDAIEEQIAEGAEYDLEVNATSVERTGGD